MNEQYWDEKIATLVKLINKGYTYFEIEAILRQIASDQREACAKIAMQTYCNPPNNQEFLIDEICEAIRNAPIGKNA